MRVRRLIAIALVALLAAAAADGAFGEDDWEWQDVGSSTGGAGAGAATAAPSQLPKQRPILQAEEQPSLQQRQQQREQQQQQRQQQRPAKDEPPKGFFDRVIDYLSNNPIMSAVMIYWIYNKFQGAKPWPDHGGNITQVASVDEWDALVGDCAQNDRVLIVDGYALWCGPCKSCAPHYARLSEELSTASCTFAKFNVDDAPDVAKKLQVSSMPCFLVYKKGQEVERLTGFPGSERLKQVLTKHGAQEAAEEEEEDDDDDDRIEDITEEVEKDKAQ